MNKIKIITFDLDDTFWDIESVIFKAEYETRNWIEKKINKKIEWGDLEDFLSYRKELIFKNPNLEWDISSLRKEIYRYKCGLQKLSDVENFYLIITYQI